jgi:hypothetical protein
LLQGFHQTINVLLVIEVGCGNPDCIIMRDYPDVNVPFLPECLADLAGFLALDDKTYQTGGIIKIARGDQLKIIPLLDALFEIVAECYDVGVNIRPS